MSADAAQTREQPAPRRGRVGVVASLASLAAGPAAWVAQLVAGYGLSSLACFPHDAPLRQTPPQGWNAEPVVLIAINLACLAIALAGLLASSIHWRRARPETPGESSDLPPVSQGRTRFLAACGMLSGLGFAIAILFDIPPILGVPACWSIPG